MSQSHLQPDKIKSTAIASEEASVAGSPVLTRRRPKLPSSSAESRASDSGIGFNEFLGCNGTAAEPEDVEADSTTTDIYVTKYGGESPQRPPTTPETEGGKSLRLSVKRSSSPQLISCDSGDAKSSRKVLAPESSAVDGHVNSHTDHCSSDLSPGLPDSPSGKDVITNIMERLIDDHVKKDHNWEPSGRYSAKANQRHSKNLVQMEQDIGKTLTKKHRAREDARRVLEMFLENSLSVDPNFRPTGHYRIQPQLKKHVTTPSSKAGGTSESPSPSSQGGAHLAPSTPDILSPVQMRRPLSTIVQDESAVERGSDVSAITIQRNSYYSAVYPDKPADLEYDCYNEVTDAIQEHVRIATPEDDDDLSPVSLIRLGEASSIQYPTQGKVIRTDVEAVDNGIYIHKHTEEEKCLSSSTSLSSILDDGGAEDLDLANRRKKSFFTKATERLRHAFNHRVQRSDSRSESEGDKYSVRPRKKKKKKKKGGLSIRRKSNNAGVADVKLLKSHQHKLKLLGVAQLDGDGLNANIWREDGLEGVNYKHRLANDKASTLPAKSIDYGRPTTEKNKEKEKKAKEKRDKEMKELMKEAKKTRKAANRSESNRSNDSLFKKWTTKRSSKVDSPAGERKSFSFGSKLHRKKKGSMELQFSHSSPTPVTSTTRNDTSKQSSHVSDERLPSQPFSADSLQIPQNQQRSKSAEEMPSPAFISQSAVGKNGQPSFALTPQHARSRSAQDTTSPFSVDDSSQPSSASPKKSPGTYELKSAHSLSPSLQRKYVPRSNGRYGKAGLPPRRHTTEVPQGDVSDATAQGRRGTPSSRRLYPAGINQHGGGLGSAEMHSSTSPQRGGSIRSVSQGVTTSLEHGGGGLGPAGGGLAPAGLGDARKHDPRAGLELPLSVDATVSRTQSVRTSGDGRRVLHTVTSLNEMVSVDQKRGRRVTPSDLESDSEIERISSLPQNMRTQGEKDKLYQHIAARISKLIKSMEEEATQSSAYATPLDEGREFNIGHIPANSAQSSSLERNSSFVSARSMSSSSPRGHTETFELHAAGAGTSIDASIVQMDNIPESSVTEEVSETVIAETSVDQLAAYLKNRGDDIHKFNPEFSAMFGSVVRENLGNLSNYEVFEQVVDDMNTNEVPYINRIASVFSVTLKAVRYLGKTGEAANRVKNNALIYIENKLADYILRNGGWDSMIEESSSEREVD